jgi:alpha-L-rhamnosidase
MLAGMNLLKVGLCLLASAWVMTARSATLAVHELRCEYRVDPAGMDVRQPRLGWILESSERGQGQTAYQVLVASSADRLEPDRVDLWDSGKVASDESVQVVYGGKALASRMQCHWKVRVWDVHDQVSAWSPTAAWTMGLLDASDWQAHWIADAGTNAIAQVARAANGYHSQIAGAADTEKWAVVDLGASRFVDGIRLFPARPFDWQPDTPGFLFPLRFQVELADQPDFEDGRTVIDQNGADVPNPGTNAPSYHFEPTRAQFVRLRVTQLPRRDGTNFAFALAELQVLAGGQPVSPGAKATALDTIESSGWSLTHLTDDVLTTVNPTPGEGALPATLLRRAFEVTTPIQRATVYATALGLYELRINGRRVGDQLLAPEWTNYRKRLQVQSQDVTGLLRDGENTLAAMVGEGWYAGRLMLVVRGAYGPQPAFLLQLEIEQVDGSRQTIVTDQSWESTTDGPIRSSGIYDGEVYDARKERPGWDNGGDPSSDWRPARVFGLAVARPSRSAPLEGESGLNPKLVWQPNEPIGVGHRAQTGCLCIRPGAEHGGVVSSER